MITKLEADNLVKKFKNFYRKDIKIDGVDVYIYNYILADHTSGMFNDKGKELRGLTITKEDAKERVFLSVPKFFNLGETAETLINVVQNKVIKKVQDKADGSMIQFIQINGEILAKTKQSFDNNQAKLAQEILETSSELQFFVLDCWDKGFFPLFELVGPSNKHILDYPNDELILISVRSSEGKFIDIDKFNYKYSAKAYDKEKYTLEYMMDAQKVDTNKEGFVVKFTDETIIKLKTLNYIQKHRLHDSAESDKYILAAILNETLDDVISEVSESKKKEIEEKETLLSNYVSHWTIFIFDESRHTGPRIDFAQKFKHHRFFSVLMRSLSLSSQEEVKAEVIKFILKKYNKEQKAKEFFEFLKK